MKTKLTVVTYNLLCVYAIEDYRDSFIHREGLIYEAVKAENPDIVAFQEVMPEQLEVLEKLLPEYAFYGQGRLENFDGEGLYIAVKKQEFMLCGLDIFWLSPKPYVPASRFEDQSEYPRICIDLLLRHKTTGKMLRVYNVHLDHIENAAKLQGMQVVLEKIKDDQKKIPAEVILLGDFNEVPAGAVIAAVREEKIETASGSLEEAVKEKLVDITASIPVSYHGFGDPENGCKIDYIFVTESLASKVESVKIWDLELNHIHLSDHYPISAVIDLKEN